MSQPIDLNELLDLGADRTITLELRGREVEICHNVAGHLTFVEMMRLGVEIVESQKSREAAGDLAIMTEEERERLSRLISAHLVSVGGNRWSDMSPELQDRFLSALDQGQHIALYSSIRWGDLGERVGKPSTSTSSASTASPPAAASDAEGSSTESAG